MDGVIYGVEATLGLSTLCCKVNLGIFKNNGTSLWNFDRRSGLTKILPQHIGRRKCCQVSSTDDRRHSLSH